MFNLKNATVLTRVQQKNVKGGQLSCGTFTSEGSCYGQCMWSSTLMQCVEKGALPSHGDMSSTRL